MVSSAGPSTRSVSPVAEDDLPKGYKPYVRVAKRRAQMLSKLGPARHLSKKIKTTEELDEEKDALRALDEANERERENARQKRTLLQEAQEVKRRKELEDASKTEAQKQAEEEAALLAEVQRGQRKLASVQEIAHGKTYTQSMKSTWRPPRYIRDLGPDGQQAVRDKHSILVEGEDPPPAIEHFADMKIPPALLEYLANKGIARPTPIQMQGLPTAFAGRDMIGIAFTGSGKTLAFTLPAILKALEMEMKLPLVKGEGPVGLVLCPSRELARQTYEGCVAMCTKLAEGGQYPELRSLLCIGGISMADQAEVLQRGVHVVVATPGRLIDMLERGRLNADNCKYMCMDEADRMIDMGFEDAVRSIMDHFKHQRQTLLFSATMPRKIQEFAQASLVNPLLVNVGRAGAANMDVIQEVEHVKSEAKMVYLLEVLQKTPPPVIIFSDNKNEVDDIQEYLLLKGVEAVAIHGSKTQDEREYAIKSFKSGAKDVMVASGVASKGLDFNEIQHVIVYTMPKEIEDYVHEIGRTGRSGKTGVATTFVNNSTSEQTLLDLKYLLMEAKQKIPQFLLDIDDPRAAAGGVLKGCPICGGLGHGLAECPKLADEQRRKAAASAAFGGDY
ncbi:hypothetical protein CspeluHIS016_0802510 [Cutaneotrichosporon spelunceum]|uniref:RNA helicase n=1 Tax=Cutaneotrichosporon spelunceum TaxID=1672016 RepID=A0AAD3YDW4_9TREE|nr:hypothetical protein CspeluHIS016_0802510 [Cutaneotrichosporon spelunceum]